MSKDIFSFSTVTSTNDVTKILLENRTNVIVNAKLQLKGRGRNNKKWIGDSEKNIFLSIGIEYKNIDEESSIKMLGYQCLGCLAVLQVLEKLDSSVKFCLKYPNDIYAKKKEDDFRKISGVLIENEFLGSKLKSTILGIGVNVYQNKFEENINATSLVLLGINIGIDVLNMQIISEIEQLKSMQLKELIEEWKLILNLEAKVVELVGREGKWKTIGFDDYGMLKVKQGNEMKTICNGDSIRYDLN
ncbi:MAG: biotin--[acetyl-CoA-carboxylase] ligase [Bacteroidetes bacterium]|nr:biotin--[acetyl-CoA-carboxylase] ligase [Bacteroidota bacterium]